MADQNQNSNQSSNQNQKSAGKDMSQQENKISGRPQGTHDQSSKGTTDTGSRSGAGRSAADDDQEESRDAEGLTSGSKESKPGQQANRPSQNSDRSK